MKRSHIFISSVQREFAQERSALRDYLREDSLMQRLFDVFLFEDVPASDCRPDALYLDKVGQSDIYVGLFGNDYGSEDVDGISPTEREFDQATDSGVQRLIFVKGTKDDDRHPKMRALIQKAQSGLIRKRFNTTEELKTALYDALVEYLDNKDLLRSEDFDASPCLNASLNDLDIEQIRWFIRTAHEKREFPLTEGVSIEELLVHLKLLNDGQLTNAAVLIFGKAPQQFLISSGVKCAHYHGTEVAKPIPSYQVYEGTAFQLVDQAVDFVLSKIALSVGTRAESVQAPVTYEIPKEVVTEAIVNAVAHRDYTSNASVQVMLFSDRLEILNPGGLPPSLTLEQLRETHPSVSSNKLLARSLYFTRYIEEMGTGTLDMIRQCRKAGLPEPEFTISGGFKTTIWRPTPPVQIKAQPELLDGYPKLVLSLLTNELTSKTELSKKLGHLESEVANAWYQYDKNYCERYGHVKIFCVGMRLPIPLDDVYVAVQFLDQHTASRYKSPEEVEQAFRERNSRPFDSVSDERQDGIQVANDKQYLMVIGGPGVGKSTFLRKVGLEALKGKNGDFTHECIPVFLELKRFTEDQIDIEALIVHEFEICGFPHPEELTNAALRSGKLLILFDGLDEVPKANVANVIGKIGDFVDQYSQNRFIASCRIAAYTGGFTRFTEVEIADFDDSQIHAYIKNWFASTPDSHRHQLDESMKTAVRCWTVLNANEHSAIKELARNPLLLTLLCMVYDSSKDFPRNRASLYEDALNIFLREWLVEKRVWRNESVSQYLDIANEKRMLSEIAAKNFETNRLFFSKDELITQIQEFGESNANTPERFNASKILDTILIDQGLFVERVRDSYSFSHLVFHEYLTANYIVGHPQSIQGLVAGHLHDEQWREVFLLTASLMREADDLLVAMEAEAAKSINTDRLKVLFRWAKKITNTSGSPYPGSLNRQFALHQCLSLSLLDRIYKVLKNIVHRYFNRNPDFNSNRGLHFYRIRNREFNLYLNQNLYLYQDLYLVIKSYVLDLDLDIEPNFNQNLDHLFNLYQDYNYNGNRYLHLYIDLCRDLVSDYYFSLYEDHYRYTGSDFYRVIATKREDQSKEKLGHQFSLSSTILKVGIIGMEAPDYWELDDRIEFVKRIEETKIFKDVDLQRIVHRFKAQREFIEAASKGKPAETSEKSIHDTWLSVLGITDDMLAISREELKNYLQYLRALRLIVACKEAAGRVSPDVWQRIENRLLAWDVEESED